MAFLEILFIIFSIFSANFLNGATILGKDVVFSGQKGTFQQAKELCQKSGYNVVRIDNDQFNVMIYNMAVKYKLGRYWIDGNDIQQDRNFVNSDGKRLTFSKFYPGEPNNYQNSEHCLQGLFYPNGLWNDINCNDINAIICSKDIQNTVSRFYEVTVSNKKLLIIPEKRTFVQAQALCHSKGLQLIKITDNNFNTQIYNLAVQYRIGRYWIDANDRQNEGNFVYTDGQKITFNKFAQGEPNNYQKNEHCVHGLYYPNALWNDFSCEDPSAVICYKETEPKISAEIELQSKYVIIFQEKTTFTEANKLCQAKGYNLIKIEDDQFNTQVYNLAIQYHAGRFWIDANDIKVEGTFEYVNGQRIKYHKFAKGEPNNYRNEDCVHGMFYKDGFWNDISCDDTNSVICYKNTQPKTSHVIKLLNRELIILQEKTTYENAIAHCKSKGFQLIKIDDDQLNSMVYNLAVQYQIGRYWIDANDMQNEGNFISSDGKKIVYRKFAPGEPNNYQKNEHCVHGLYYSNALWNDISCADSNAVICYKESKIEVLKKITVLNKELVIFKERLTYYKAQDLCKSQGYKLVKIDDEQFNSIVYNYAVQNNIGRYWIDANDVRIEGTFEDSDKNKIKFSKWAAGEPNNYQNEDCVHGLYYKNALWNDIKCEDLNAVICYKNIGSRGFTKFEISNKEIVIFEEKVVFKHAQLLCKNNGYELLKIDSDEINSMIYDFAVKHNIGTYWIDANDIQTENTFVYSDSKKISYQKWYPGEPNNYENEDCVHGLYYKNGLWNDIKCDYKNSVICSKDILNSNETIKQQQKYYVHEVLVTYEEAINFCNQHNCRIVKISNEETNKIIYEWSKNMKIGRFWINGNDIITEGKWVDSKGNKLVYLNWAKNEPNNYNNEDCLEGNFYPNGEWNDISCKTKNYLIYEYESTAEKEITIEIMEGKVNYIKALELCKSKGYDLIRIENEEINKIVYDVATKNKVGQYWINANDINVEGQFIYSDGQNISYRNFAHGEPNNQNNEDCVHGLFYTNGLWNDISCNSINSVLCYKPFKEDKDEKKEEGKIDTSKYFVHTGRVTYEEALRFCQIHSCRLVTIENSELDILILNLARKHKISGYWLDGNDIKKEGEWVNIDGNKLKYLNWNQGEPNNYGNEDCLLGNYFANGKWNDFSCSTKNSFIYYYIENIISTKELEIFKERVTFEEAQNTCIKKGWSLVRIDNEETNQNIYDLAVKNKIGQYWIDANDKAVEGKFVDSNNHALKYSKFPRGEPNNYGNEDCVHGLYYSNGFWNDIACNSKNSFICSKYSPPIIFIDEHMSYKIFINKVTYREAVDKCQSEGYSLIKVENSDISFIVHTLSLRYKLVNYWIDGTDSKNDGKWTFSDGQQLTFKNWQTAPLPSDKENNNCLYSSETLSGKWLGTSCVSKNSVICYKPSKTIDTGKEVKKTKYYIHRIGVTFQEALDFCKERRCKLIVVDNIDTNIYLWELSKKLSIEKYWLNGNDKDNEGAWIDSDKKKLTFFNWTNGKVNIQKTQNCLQGNPDGKWRDVSCDDKNPFFFEFIDENEQCKE